MSTLLLDFCSHYDRNDPALVADVFCWSGVDINAEAFTEASGVGAGAETPQEPGQCHALFTIIRTRLWQQRTNNNTRISETLSTIQQEDLAVGILFLHLGRARPRRKRPMVFISSVGN